MAYRSQINARQRSGAITAVAAIHAALLLALLNLSGKTDLASPQSALRIIDIRQLLPPPTRELPHAKPKPTTSGSAPKTVKSDAAPVIATKTPVEAEPTVVASATPRQPDMPTGGDASEAGAGVGSGGLGSGSGGSGTGSGGADVAEPPLLASPVLSGRDFPNDLLRAWPRGATIFLRLRVDARGTVAECSVDRGTGVVAIDALICNLAHDRLRFRPAFNRSGQAVAGWSGYAQPAPR